MIDLLKIPASDAERIAYAEGFTGVAALYARLSDAEHKVSTLEDDLEDLTQTLLQCLPFFENPTTCEPRTMEFMIRLIKQSLGETL